MERPKMLPVESGLPVKSGLSVTEVVDRMIGVDSLDGWGVLVAYDETVLNKLLAARHATLSSNLSTISSLEAVVPGSSKTIKYRDVKLGSPLMKLNAQAGIVHLFFSVEGWYTDSGAAEAKFGDGVFLDVTAKLVTTTGQGASKSQTPAGAVHVFEGSATSQCEAAIDLSAPLVQLVDRDHAPLDTLGDVASALTIHIASVGLSYRLTTLQNSASTGSVTLKPKEFVMTTVETKNGNPGALLIWISVEGAKSRGTLPSEDDNVSLVFARKVKDLCNVNPIPKGYTSCIVISQDVFGTLFIKPQMEKLQYSDFQFVKNTPAPGAAGGSIAPDTGLSFQAKPPSREVKQSEINEGDGKTKAGLDHVDAVSFNMNANHCKFFIDKTSSYAYLEYVVDGVSYYHEDTDYLRLGVLAIPLVRLTPIGLLASAFTSGGFTGTVRHDGKAKFTFKATGNGTWKAAGDEGFAVSFALPASFTVIVDTETRNFFSKTFLRVMDTKLGPMERLETSVPDVTVDLGSIQLFLATNLLLPGEHIFKLKSVPENLYMPHDIYLLGDI